ncbi:hypothetical protein PM082_018522 [Marasmius tenuissimus]|nr:hypothetical protein PM082_018522 [Marasmius tenuissimus]
MADACIEEGYGDGVSADGESWEIVTGKTVSAESDSRNEKRKLQQKDKVVFAIICSLLHTSTHTIIDNLTTKTCSAAYKALKAKYEGNLWKHHITLQKAFHSIIHDPAHPIKIYLSAMKTACQCLQDIGVTIDNTYYKDLILANLNKSYGQICTSLLSSDATIEPTIQAVISTLENAGPIIDFNPNAPVPAVIKEEHVKGDLMDGAGKSGSGTLKAHGRNWGSMENEGDMKKWCINQKEVRRNYADSDNEVMNLTQDESSSLAFVTSSSGFHSQSPSPQLLSSDVWDNAYNNIVYVDLL